ncbi:MAG: SRPBCC family protein [Gemmatimonadota bacterium]|nr:SRPBCC family protein [Gemmatimonadota bacterium]
MIHGAEPLISLPATDVKRAVRFYTETLGMRLLFGAEERGFYIFGGDREMPTTFGVHASTAELSPVAQQDLWLWLLVDDVSEMRGELARRGVRLIGEVAPRGPGNEQALLDSEGNLVRLWSRIRELRRSVDIAADPDAVFAMLSDARAIERWFATIDDVALDPRAGGRIAFIDPLFGRVTGRVSAFDPPRRIAFEFDENWPRSLEITVEPTSALTRVHVYQHGFDAIGDRDFGIPGLIARVEEALAGLARGEAGAGSWGFGVGAPNRQS